MKLFKQFLLYVVALTLSLTVCQNQPKKSKFLLNFFEDISDLIFNSEDVSKCDPQDPERIKLVENYINSNKESLSSEDINLIKFISGDCLPVIFVPGFYGNKFQVHITNCTALNLNHPKIASACKWDTKCEDGYEKMFWLSEHFESHDGSTCFGELIKLNIKKNDTETDLSKKYTEEAYKGFRLVYFGNTPRTESENECGFGASSNLLDKPFYFGAKSVLGSIKIKEHFLKLGYRLGVNLFSVPHDWRRTSNDPFNFEMVRQTVDLAFNLTQKKAILIGHSFGSQIALNYLYSIDQSEKENKIERFIAIGPVFAGVSLGVKSSVLGYDEFNMLYKYVITILDIYLSLENQKIMQSGNSVNIEMLPKMFWKLNKNEEFMSVIRNRTYVENKITECVRDYFNKKAEEEKILINYNLNFLHDYIDNSKDDENILSLCINNMKQKYANELETFKSMFPFYPDIEIGCNLPVHVETTCSKSPYCKTSIWDKYCRLNIVNPLDFYMINITTGNTTYNYHLTTEENIYDMIKRFGIGNPDMDFVKFVYESLPIAMQKMDHPQVPVTVFFSSVHKTSIGYSSPVDPKIFTDQNKYVTQEVGEDATFYGGGDGTVPSSGTLIPSLKWTHQKESEKFPIHLFEYCSDEKNNLNKEFIMEQNQYRNLNCRCKKPNQDGCQHSAMIGDENIINKISFYSIQERNRLPLEKVTMAIDLIARNMNKIETRFICSNLKAVEEMFKGKYFQ